MSAEFDAAVARVSELSQDPGNDVKLKLYALYKQATSGDSPGNGPGSPTLWAVRSTTRGRYVRPVGRGCAGSQYIGLVDSPVVRWDAAAYDGDFHLSPTTGRVCSTC